MRYQSANEILPQPLVKELQKYASGSLIYIPATAKKSWGERSGAKIALMNRNNAICKAYKSGETVASLAQNYYLAESTIKNILYKK